MHSIIVTAQNDPYKLLSPRTSVLATFVAVVIDACLRRETHRCKTRSPVECNMCQMSGVVATLSSTSRASQTWCFPECWSYIVCIHVCQREKVSLCQAVSMILFETVRIPIQKKITEIGKFIFPFVSLFLLEYSPCSLQCCSRIVALRTFLNDPNKSYFEILWNKVLLR